MCLECNLKLINIRTLLFYIYCCFIFIVLLKCLDFSFVQHFEHWLKIALNKINIIILLTAVGSDTTLTMCVCFNTSHILHFTVCTAYKDGAMLGFLNGVMVQTVCYHGISPNLNNRTRMWTNCGALLVS